MNATLGSVVYKIQRFDGLFSTGGWRPSFSVLGKVYKRRSDLNSHLNLVRRNCRPQPYRTTYPWPYDNCVVMVYPIAVPVAIEPIEKP